MVIAIVIYAVLGFVLLLFNIPPLVAILSTRDLCIRYGVLAALLLPCCVNGAQCIGQAILRTIINAGTYKPVQHNAIDCFANPLVLFDQFTFTALPVMLMMNSIDRLLVLVAPLNYYTSTKMYIVVQVSAAYAFIFFVLCVTVIWTAISQQKTIAIFCM
ncbi:hypothetical protein Tcan_11901 [Toxocara canis]|uniref:G_PROTEIN_RECEP_F1_2 domain-containing protein n=1 Tax=Toxocara canis TaxID=6265 RepID=A0A0B2VCX5_TOXCA|nr:hypothetical protein Tcan_11901 [Toxocara canis]